MIEHELTVSKNEIVRPDITLDELKIIAEKKASFILQKISDSDERIKKAKEAGKGAQNMKTGWFGRTSRKTDAVADGLVMTNEAVAEMNDLIQESIRFTCTSIQFAQIMQKVISDMMVSGFRDSNNNVQKMSESAKRAVQIVWNDTDDFVRKQLAVEKAHNEIRSRVDGNVSRIEENRSKINENKQINVVQDAMIQDALERIKRIEMSHKKQSDIPIILSCIALAVAMGSLFFCFLLLLVE